MADPLRSGRFSIPILLLLIFGVTYALYFSWYTLNRHQTLNSYAADLSLIDQPLWNTGPGPGYFMELTWGDRQQPRLAEHFEPLLVPLAWLFFLWDDVRLLLVIQTVALALGALPVYWIARKQLTLALNPESYTGNENQYSRQAGWAALVFSGVYLLSPHLQAANIADFHADPFVVAPLLFAFWYAGEKRWGWMWAWAIIAMLTKETLPLLTAMLGLWLVIKAYSQAQTNPISPPRPPAINSLTADITPRINNIWLFRPLQKAEAVHGLGLMLVSMSWFLVATFFIVAPLARQYFGTDGPIYLANRYQDGLAELVTLLQDPARWQYLLGLLASVGFLPLLAPELLLLGLPVLAANLLSNFPGQYSGEQHYSAPLVAALILAAIYGLYRLICTISLREKNRQSLKTTTLIATMLWLAGWSLGYHTLYGWTPLSVRIEQYTLSPAAARLPDFKTQIPAGAIVSASAAVHPHLAHRRVIYLFPTIQDADYMLVDVADIPGVHPYDAQVKIMSLLNGEWQLLEADQGLILAQKSPTEAANSLPACASTLPLPCSFYDFARTTIRPTYTTRLTFGDKDLRLLGYDMHDDPDDGVIFRFYWQALRPLPAELRLWPLVYDDLGRLLADPTQIPMIAAVWFPPSVWRPSEIVVTETLPQLLPNTFHLGLAVGPENSLAEANRRYAIAAAGDESIQTYPGRWAQLATFQRQGPFLNRQPATATLQPLTPTDVQFGPAISLTGYWFEENRSLQPGTSLPVLLEWSAHQPPHSDFTVFVHLQAEDGSLVTQNDSFPTWLTPLPTSGWPLHQPLPDSHFLPLPDSLPPGHYTLQVGLYNAQTLERLPLADGRDSFRLGRVKVKKQIDDR